MAGFRDRLQADKARSEQLRQAQERERVRAEAIAAETASSWPSAKAALWNAIRNVNQDFIDEGMPNRFDIAPSAERRDGWPTVDRIDLIHGGGTVRPCAYRSKVDVDVRSAGTIEVRGVLNGIKKTWKVSEATENAWRALLEEIYETDKKG